MLMLRRPIFFVLAVTLLGLLLVPQSAQAQFYYNGRGPMGMHWRQMKSPTYKLIYPASYAPTAVAMAGFLDSIAPGITHGFTRKPQRLPIVLHTENLRSNGEVVWSPKRMELMTTAPAGDIYADPWLKQLAVHESRHVVQLSSLHGGLTKIATWLLGEAGATVGMIVVPKWFLEGDATLAETQYSEFGRGLQPSFTVGMRALFAADSSATRFRSDRWIAGSYRTFVPGLYEYGYQMVAAGERYYGPEMWGRAVEYAGKYPIFIVPMRIYLKRHYKAHLSDISDRALDDLYRLWKPYSAVPNDYRTLTRPVREGRSYTTYSNPLFVPGQTGGGIVAVKTDYDAPARFVTLDTTGRNERRVAWIAPPSSRPMLDGSMLYWTEFKPHPVWEYKTYSVVRSLDLATGKRRVFGRWAANYFATPVTAGDGRRLIATVSPDSLGGSDLVLHDATDFRETGRLKLNGLTTAHGLAWDAETGSLAFIALGERGMNLRRCGVTDDGRFTAAQDITEPSMVTLSGLTADGRGRLWFGSIESGKDEIHTLDLTAEGFPERRITTSRFGAYGPSAVLSGTGDSSVLFTTYTADGYMVAKTEAATKQGDTVVRERLPKNLLNIPAPQWEVPAMSSLSMGDTVTQHKVRRYNRGLRWFNVHSWAPLTADVDNLLDASDRTFNLGFGASLFFQSVMGDSYGSATYGRLNGDSWLQASWTYAGLPVQFKAEVEYGGGDQGVYIPAGGNTSGVQAPADLKTYLHVTGTVTAPFTLSGGSHIRLLQPSFSVTHFNSLLYDPATYGFDQGYQKYKASLWWSDHRRPSVRSVVPRLGYALRADVSGAFSDRFGTTFSLFARGYLPGVMANHSVTLRAAGMYQTASELGFTQKPLFPRGAYNGWSAKYFGAGAVDYTFPLWCPDGGINGVIHFKRIWANLFGDYSRGDYFAGGGTTRKMDIWSYGGDLAFDLNVLGSTSPATVKFTFASPSNDKFYFGVGLSMSF